MSACANKNSPKNLQNEIVSDDGNGVMYKRLEYQHARDWVVRSVTVD